jgi:hypothetical protein
MNVPVGRSQHESGSASFGITHSGTGAISRRPLTALNASFGTPSALSAGNPLYSMLPPLLHLLVFEQFRQPIPPPCLTPGAQAIFCRRRHQPRKPPLADIRPGPRPTRLQCLKQKRADRGRPARSQARRRLVGGGLQPLRRRTDDGVAPRREDHPKPRSAPAIRHRRPGRARPPIEQSQ